MDKYIKCDCCDKKIYFGDTVYYDDEHYYHYCSEKCFLIVNGRQTVLDEQYADFYDLEVYDNEKVAQRKAEIKSQITALKKRIKIIGGIK